MSILSPDILIREETLVAFFESQAGVDTEMAITLAQNINAKLITPIIDRGEWSLMYNDDELEEMIRQGAFPLIEQMIDDAYAEGFQSCNDIEELIGG